MTIMPRWFLFIFFVCLTAHAGDYRPDPPPPLMDQETSAEWVSSLTVYLYRASKFKLSDRPEMEQWAKNLDARLTTDELNPALWFLKARIDRLFLTMRARKIKHLPRDEYFNDPEFKRLKESSIAMYQKALQLDANEKAPMHLDYLMLDTIAMDVFAPADMQIESLKRAMTAENQPIVDDSEYYQYSHLLAAYYDAGRQQDAMNLLKEMESKADKRFPHKKKEITDAIVSLDVKLKTLSGVDGSKTATETSTAPSTQPSVSSDTSATEKPTPDETTQDRSLPKVVNYKLIAILTGILILIVVISVALYRRKKKSKA